MTHPTDVNRLYQSILNSLNASDLEGVIDALATQWTPAGIADIVQTKVGAIRVHDFVRPITATGTWRVQEIRENATGRWITAARHPSYDYVVSGPPKHFISLENPEETGDANPAAPDFNDLQQDLEQAPKVKAYLQGLSHEFLHTDLPITLVAEAVCSLVGDI